MFPDPLIDYAAQSPLTDPAACADGVARLPTDLDALHQITQNILIHVWKVRKYNPEWLTGRTDEYELRAIADLLTAARQRNFADLIVTRPKHERLIVDCRHFATLLCALLRAQGVPARVRCGFATYLEDTHYQDHWLCEYWNGQRWMLEDPDLRKHDVSRDEFIVAGQAGQMARSGVLPADQFGYDPQWRGWWVIRHDVTRDLAALNKMEMLSSDDWGMIAKEESDVTEEDRALLDRAAALTLAGNESFAELRAFYRDQPLLRVPRIIRSYNYVADETITLDLGLPDL